MSLDCTIKTNMSKIINQLNRFCDKQPFKVGWHIKNLETGEEFNRNGGNVFSSASVRKIAILMAALNAVNENKVSLDKKITIQKKFQRNHSGPVRFLKPGFTITFKDALILMIVVSDCTCAGYIVNILGVNKINSYCKSIGLKKTKIIRGFPPLGKESLLKYRDLTTPDDMTNLLNLILNGAKTKQDAIKLGCTTRLCKLALEILNNQELNTRLPFLLPNKTKVAHKTGTRRGINNDAGIVYFEEKPLFIISVFTQSNNNTRVQKSEVNLFIAKLCRLYFDSLVKN